MAMKAIHNQLTQLYCKNLFEKPSVLKYLKERGIKKTTIQKFWLGYCDNNIGYRNLRDKFSDDELIESGLFYKNEMMNDRFNGRITIPIIHNKEVIYMTSRLFPEIKNKITHLHQHGPIDLAINFDVLENSNSVIIVEGPFDCFTLDQNNIPCIGLLGANRISIPIIKALMHKRVYIAFDNDPNETGQKAAKRLGTKLNRYGIIPAILTLPRKNDHKIDINLYFQSHTKSDFMGLIKEAYIYRHFQKLRKTKLNKDIFHIIEIARKYGLETKQYGAYTKCVCPFHEESHPSLVFYPDTGTWYCFGCTATGNGIGLIIKLEQLKGNNCSYMQAREIAKNFVR